MLAQNIGIVLVRLFSIYLAITAVQSMSFVLPSYVQLSYQGGDLQELLTSAALWLTVTAILLPAICAIWLWRNAGSVMPKEMEDDRPSANASDIMLIGVSLLGLYLLVWGLVGLVRVESAFAGLSHVDTVARMSQRLAYLAEIAVAVPLILGRRRLSELLLKARYAGTGSN